MHERKIHLEKEIDLAKLDDKKRVCAYARVSASSDLTWRSLSAQVNYYQETISAHPGWEFAGVYSDYGQTGTKAKRKGFQDMLEACRNGGVDIVMTKSISRFARNTTMLLETIRELKELGVDVYFEEEDIHSQSSEGEFILSVLAARAQEESRSTSDNIKWRIKKLYEQGRPYHNNTYGYRAINHEFFIHSDEAEVVKRIFEMYLSGIGELRIAKTLTRENITSPKGKPRWYPKTIKYILSNVMYKGDLVLHEHYVENHLSKKLIKNTGERPVYYVEDDHDPIISPETFEAVQQEIVKRQKQYVEVHSEPNCLSGKLICSNCGWHYQRAHKGKRTRWTCGKRHMYGKAACDNRSVQEDMLRYFFSEITGAAEFEESLFNANIEKIYIDKDNGDGRYLRYVFTDGKVVRIRYHSGPPKELR